MFKIINGNNFEFVACFDGQEYRFPPTLSGRAQPVYCDDAAAQHIFGLGDPDKTPYLARHGWASVMGGLDEGLAILNKFKFQSIVQKFDAPMANARTEHDPALVSEGAGGDGSTADDVKKTPLAADGTRAVSRPGAAEEAARVAQMAERMRARPDAP